MSFKTTTMQRTTCHAADAARRLTGPPVKRALRITKLIFLLGIVTCLQSQAAIYAQPITLHRENAPLKEIFYHLYRQSGYQFVYTNDLISRAKPVTLDIVNEPLEKVLETCFRNQPFGYVLQGKTVVLQRLPAPHVSPMTVPPIHISGKVTDSLGRPLPGVTVQVKGQQTGVVTDDQGNYTLEAADDATLLISYIGYVEQEIPVSGRSHINVVLREEISALNQLVVVGYGTQERKDVTGAMTRIRTDKTAELPDYNVLQSLQGRVAGLNITTPVRPGASPGMLVRGLNSISAGNSPLVVVDGIIYNGSLSDFNTNDIATVDILKDASAAAVYGSRAANGVLLITTKTGTSSKPRFNFNTYQGIQHPVRLIPVMDGPGYIQKILDYREATGLEADPARIEDYLTVTEAENYRQGKTTDWVDKVIQTGITSNYHLDVSGKTSKTDYYLSGTYFKQKGIVVNDKYDRVTLNMNLTNHITDWYFISAKSMFSFQHRPGRPASITQAFWQSPYGSLLDDEGPGGYAYYPVGDPLGVNPLINPLIESNESNTSLWGLFSSNLDLPFIPGLRWTLNYSSNLRLDKSDVFFDNKTSNTGIIANGRGMKDETTHVDWTLDNILNYHKTFGSDHSIYVTLLYSREGSRLSASGLSGSNFFTQVLGYNNLGLAEIQEVSSNYEDQSSISYMARLNYSFRGTYAITLTARRDGYSGFSKNNKYATFPSVALAWTASNEPFLKGHPWLDFLKLRLSYGNNGNQAVGRYRSLAKLNSDKYVFDQQTTTSVYVSSMANDDLSWETTTTENAGLDFELLHGAISGSIDVYASQTRGILLERALPEVTGFSEIFTNIGKVHNHGVEVTLNSTNLNKGDWRWESGLVFSLNRNKIVELTGQGDDIRDGWFIGKPLNSIFGYRTDGIYQLDDHDIPAGFEPGDFRIYDRDHSGTITSEDREILGNTLPNYSIGLNNTLRYKQFSLYLLVNSIQGGHGYYLGNNNATRNVNAPFTTFTERFNIQNVPYWTPSRPSNTYPIINYIPPFPHPILEDRSFVRIQDLSLAYTFAARTLASLKLDALKVYVSGKNLYTFTHWTGYDPENATTISGFPLMRSYIIGLDLSF